MKICIFRHPETIHCRKWAISLAKEGFEIEIVYFEGDLDAWDSLPNFPDLEKAGVSVKMLKIRKTNINLLRRIEKHAARLPFFNPYHKLQIKEFKKYLKETNPDILHSFGFDYYGFWGTKTNFSPHLATVLGSDISEPNMSISKKKRVMVAAKANAVHLHDKYGYDRLLQLNAKPTKAYIHQWGVDSSFYNPKLRSEEIRKEIMGNSQFLITCVRNLSPIYNLNIFLKSAQRILKSHPQSHFLLIGKGSQKNELEKYAVDLGIKNQVTFTGGVSSEKVATLLACSDIVVDTYQAENGGGGIGMGVLEAMASGVPPIIVSNPWIDTMMKKHRIGHKYIGGDALDLASKLVTLLDNPQRKTLGKKCREVVLEHYNWQNSIKYIKNIYQELKKG